MLQKLIYQLSYTFGQSPWDTLDIPAELIETLQTKSPTTVFDIGCGTGNHSIYAAQRGATVIGIDFVDSAIKSARNKAKAANVNVTFQTGDITQLQTMNLPPIDLVLDIKCTHALPVDKRISYVSGIASLLKPDGLILMEALPPRNEMGFRFGMNRQDVEAMMSPHFNLTRVKDTNISTWYWLENAS